MNKKSQPSILEASLVLTFIIASIALSVIVLKVTPNIAILFSIALVLLYVVFKRIPFDRVNEGIVNGIKPGITPIFIFLLVGAIASGAIFGDKMSPLSESTNLAAAIAEVDLFKHIRNMMWSTIPAFIVSLLLFSVLGISERTVDLAEIELVVQVLESHFTISLWALLPIVMMFVCAWRRIPAMLTLLLNIGIGIIFILVQTPETPIIQVASFIESGFVSDTGNRTIDLLLSRGGIASMMPTVSLILLTLSLGGLLMETNLIGAVMNVVAHQLKRTSGVIIASLLTSIGVNLFIGEQFLSVILPGNAFKQVYKENHIDLVVLSRSLEDGGTVMNYLIPWGIAGSFVAGTFGIPTITYLPFVFFSLLSPIFSMLSAITGIGVSYTDGTPSKKFFGAK